MTQNLHENVSIPDAKFRILGTNKLFRRNSFRMVKFRILGIANRNMVVTMVLSEQIRVVECVLVKLAIVLHLLQNMLMQLFYTLNSFFESRLLVARLQTFLKTRVGGID